MVEIRPEKPEDVRAIELVTVAAFVNAPQASHSEQFIVHALRILRERAAAGCVVVGEPRCYGRFGFGAEPALTLAGVPAEYFQVLLFHSAMPEGAVSYHEAFAAKN